MSIQSFYSYIVNKYISNDGLKKCLLEKVYNLNPYELWEFLHNSEVFDESFINQVNAIYNYEDFILISHARMAIEYLVFGLNISLKSTLYEFSYIAQFKLKSLLHFIHEFLKFSFDSSRERVWNHSIWFLFIVVPKIKASL